MFVYTELYPTIKLSEKKTILLESYGNFTEKANIVSYIFLSRILVLCETFIHFWFISCKYSYSFGFFHTDHIVGNK